jgi:hypothetical protein
MPLTTVETIQLFLAGPAEQVRAGLEPYIEAGARHIVCRIAALDPDTQREQLERASQLPSTVDRG